MSGPSLDSSGSAAAWTVSVVTPYHRRRGCGGGGGHKQVVINKKPKRRRRSETAEQEHSKILVVDWLKRRMMLPSTQFGRPFLLNLLLLFLLLFHFTASGGLVLAEDSQTSTTTLPHTISIPSEDVGESTAGAPETGPPIRPSAFVPTSPQPKLTACDRSRKVFTSASGEISDGPTGTNYTQVRTVTRV